MLVLTRGVNQTLYIGDDIKVTVLSVQGKQARIGIAAPADIAIHREEIYTKQKNTAAPAASRN